ncbi:MAG: hypothetical protein R3257_02965 [bacterium]|nr:hypothetical protein [bacterium]
MAVLDSLRPSRFYYVLSVLVGLFGLGVLFWLFITALGSIGEGLSQFEVPGSAVLDLKKAGGHTVYYESQSVFKGRVYDSGESVPGLSLKIYSNDTGTEIPVRETQVSSTYTFGGRKGRAIYRFSVPQPGPYTFTGTYQTGEMKPQIILAVGQGFNVRLVIFIFVGIGVFILTLLLSVGIAIITFLKRDKQRQKLRKGLG